MAMIPGLLLIGAALALAGAVPAQTGRLRVDFHETEDLLANPGMGWQTFHTFADADPALQGLPSASAYFRFYWREVEPADGQIDFAKFDELLAHAHRAGQKLAFRIMCTGSGEPMDVPAWLRDQGCRGVEFDYEGRRHWVPDFEDPLFQKAHFRLIRELGRRYDGHPDLDLVDIGSVGLWGEWHMSSTKDVATGQEVALPPMPVRIRIVDAWRRAFPKTPTVMLIGGQEALRHAVANGCGWRADCLGDMGGFSKTWNHMDNAYPQAVQAAGAADAWKVAPVAWETCWDMRKWQQEGWGIRAIFDYALRYHGSYVNNKSAPIPEGGRPEVERLLRRLGYRLVVHSVEHDRVARRGGTLAAEVLWENVGVAPPYRDGLVALRLKGPREEVWQSASSVRGWLPARHRTALSMPVPLGLPGGRYSLSIAVVDPSTRLPGVRLAIPGRQPDGWYDVSRVEVR